MITLLKAIRAPFIIVWVILFILYTTIISIFITHINKKIRFRIKTTSFFCRMLLIVLGIKIKIEGLENIKSFKGGLIVANHLSYIDIFLLISILPSVFVSSVEVKKTFLLGYIVKLGGAIFIERRSKTGVPKEIEKISQILREGFNITFFPEGTTTNGEKLKKFKSSFFESALITKKDILPVCIFYESIGKENINEKNRDKIFYYGDMKFFPHFLKFLFIESIKIKLVFIQPLSPQENNNRKEISEILYHKISYEYEKLKEKTIRKEEKYEKETESFICVHS